MANTNKKTVLGVIITAVSIILFAEALFASDPVPPAEPVKLIFIHHSTGGNWLADPSNDNPSGGLGIALRDAGYFVSATNYGWGPDDIGSRTDIPNWPEWFTGSNSAAILNALYSENGQNFGGHGYWSRLSTEPDGENEIIMFKSCFPNSDLYGSPDDPPAADVSDAFTVANAKAVYMRLLTFFQSSPDKLFIAITAPPLLVGDTDPHRSANARAFNDWLVFDWLDGYPLNNVAVFDYFNVLTARENHHRWIDGAVSHEVRTLSNTSAYPTGDSHPNSDGHRKATAEFVPLLNHYYQLWKTGDTQPDTDIPPSDTDDPKPGDNQDSGGDTLPAGLIRPSDLQYKGAFRLPAGTDGVTFGYTAGEGMTFFPEGDISGSEDGYPGSLFVFGFDSGNTINRNRYLAEITIPAAIISEGKSPSELNTASFIQPFSDIGVPADLELARTGVAWFRPPEMSGPGKLHYCFGRHFQSFEPSHAMCEMTLSNPGVQGPWIFGDYTNYVTNDYLFEIPKPWADAHAPGRFLASGRFREGGWSGRGPALFAYNPSSGRESGVVDSVVPLLLYGVQQPGVPEIASDATMEMTDYNPADDWSGGEWLTAGDGGAVIFLGTRALGNSWYGFANGVEWDFDCAEPDTPPCPQIPPWPNNDRGWWADSYRPVIIFYNPEDLADVAAGEKAAYDPQPYASMNLDDCFFDPEVAPARYKRHFTGAAAFDRNNRLLYIFERMADGIGGDENGLIHVFRIAVTHSDNDPDDGDADDNDPAQDPDDEPDADETDTPDQNGGNGDEEQPSDPVETDSGGGGGGCFISTPLFGHN